jgi:hypothetical protein
MAKSVIANHEYYDELRLSITVELKRRLTEIDQGLTDLYAGKKTRYEMRRLLADNEALPFSMGTSDDQIFEVKEENQ